MIEKKIHIYFLFLFITCLVMNAITYTHLIFLIGKYGKLIIAVIGIIYFQKTFNEFIYFIKNYKYLVLFWVCCMVFTLHRIIDKGLNIKLLQNNFLFILFIYFFYLLSKAYRKRHLKPDLAFFKYMSQALNVNLIFWTIVAFIFSFNIWHTLEDRTGLGLFYENYLQLGIFACVGSVVHIYLIKNLKTQRIVSILFLVVYTLLVVLSNSRNAQFVLFLFGFLALFPVIKKTSIRYIYVILSIIAITAFTYFSNQLLLNDQILAFTTGRSYIWYLIFEHYQYQSIFIGEGIFGLNETILTNNLASNYYFQRLDFLYFHSSYVEAFCASGIIGFGFLLCFFIHSFRKKITYDTVSVLICISLGGLFESYIIQPTILISFLFWYLMVSKNGSRYKKVAYLPTKAKAKVA